MKNIKVYTRLELASLNVRTEIQNYMTRLKNVYVMRGNFKELFINSSGPTIVCGSFMLHSSMQETEWKEVSLEEFLDVLYSLDKSH